MKTCISVHCWWIFFLYFVSSIEGQQQTNKLVQLFDSSSENVPKCGGVFFQGIDTYVVRGQVNNSGIDLKSITVDKVYPTNKIFDCLLVFPKNCDGTNSTGSCRCNPTSNKDIYDLQASLALETKDSSAKVKFSLSIYNQDNVNSEEVILPKVYDLNSTKINIELKINDQTMDINNCQLNVSNRLVIVYKAQSEPKVSNQLVLSYNSKNLTFKAEENVPLELTDLTGADRINFKLNTCGKEMKTFNCYMPNAQESDSDSSDWRKTVAIVLPIVLLGAIILVLGFVFKKQIGELFAKKCKTKNADEKEKGETVKADKETFRLIEAEQDKAKPVDVEQNVKKDQS